MNDDIDRTISVDIISNIIIEPYFTSIIKTYFGEKKVEVHSIPYGEHKDEDHTKKFKSADLIVVWMNFEEMFPDVLNNLYSRIISEQQVIADITNMCKGFYVNLVACSNAQILWFSFENYFYSFSIAIGHETNTLIDKINLILSDVFYDKAIFIDLKHLIAEVGIRSAYDLKSKYRWNAPYSKLLIDAAAKEIRKQYLIAQGITKKCLVLDCDNVLWGGILSEDGIENLKLGANGIGRIFQDFQRFVLSLYYHGVILAICSKNDLSDVIKVFREHNEMILKEEHIACFQVNWGNKQNNIKRISEVLNLGLESIIFIDDSPIETEAVKAFLPEVTTILYERGTVNEQMSCFNLMNKVCLSDIERRNKTYQTNKYREELELYSDNYRDYINALEIKMDIHEATVIEFSRISELTQRVNKCTNGKRYTIAEIKERCGFETIKLYSISVSDRFSDLGLVGALEVEGDTLTLFCLSCRALGREVEGKMLEFIADKHRVNNIELISTGKNEDITSLLLKHGTPKIAGRK